MLDQFTKYNAPYVSCVHPPVLLGVNTGVFTCTCTWSSMSSRHHSLCNSWWFVLGLSVLCVYACILRVNKLFAMDHHAMVVSILRQPWVRSHTIRDYACSSCSEPLNLRDEHSLAPVLHLHVTSCHLNDKPCCKMIPSDLTWSTNAACNALFDVYTI